MFMMYQMLNEVIEPKVIHKTECSLNLDISRLFRKQDNADLVKKVLNDFENINTKPSTKKKTFDEFYTKGLGTLDEFYKKEIGELDENRNSKSPEIVFVAYENSYKLTKEQTKAIWFMTINMNEHDIYMPMDKTAGTVSFNSMILEKDFILFWLNHAKSFSEEHKKKLDIDIYTIPYESRLSERIDKYDLLVELDELHEKATDNPTLWPKYHSFFLDKFGNYAHIYGKDIEKFGDKLVNFLDKTDKANREKKVIMPLVEGLLENKHPNQTIFMAIYADEIGRVHYKFKGKGVNYSIFSSY